MLKVIISLHGGRSKKGRKRRIFRNCANGEDSQRKLNRNIRSFGPPFFFNLWLLSSSLTLHFSTFSGFPIYLLLQSFQDSVSCFLILFSFFFFFFFFFPLKMAFSSFISTSQFSQFSQFFFSSPSSFSFLLQFFQFFSSLSIQVKKT